MCRKLVITLAILMFACPSLFLHAETSHRELSVAGNATLQVEPDQAVITIGVVASEKDAVAAKTIVDQRITKYMDFLKQYGVSEKEINAANLQTSPEYGSFKFGDGEIKGYRAERVIVVSLKQLDRLNELLDAALKQELNEIRSVEFSVAKPELYRAEVRQKAIDDAMMTAQSVAQGFGVKLGTVQNIVYSNGSVEVLNRNQRAMSTKADITYSEGQSYQPQSIHFSDHVEAVFELQP